jgi:hypothetical protein
LGFALDDAGSLLLRCAGTWSSTDFVWEDGRMPPSDISSSLAGIQIGAPG